VGLRCSALAFTQDGSALIGLFKEVYDGWRVVRWDVKNGTLQGSPAADYPFPPSVVDHEASYRGPALECLPGKAGWLLFGQTLIDAGTGKARTAFTRVERSGRPTIRALTAQYVLDCGGREVRITPIPQGK